MLPYLHAAVNKQAAFIKMAYEPLNSKIYKESCIRINIYLPPIVSAKIAF